MMRYSAALLLLVLIASLSTAYAMWSETLRINVTVNTGEVDWEIWHVTWDDLTGNDYNAIEDPVGGPPYYQVDKDVGSTNAVAYDSDGDGDLDSVNVTLTNVYPRYFTHLSLILHNDGTIPIKVWKVVIDDQEFYGIGTALLDLNGDGKHDVKVWWGNNFGQQLEPCNQTDLSFYITVLQDAPENANLKFTIQLVAVQWNEYSVPSRGA